MAMNKYYATFMQHQAFKNHYVEIIAENESIARAVMFDHFGRKWFTTYSEEKFAGQIEQFNLDRLLSITAIDHKSSIEYILT